MRCSTNGRVSVYCTCSGIFTRSRSIANDADINTEKIGESQINSDLKDPNNLHHLPSLLFCESCCTTRCDKCVTKIPVVTYCSGCLTIVPKTEYTNNCCMRNCFVCPACSSNLTISSTNVIMPGDCSSVKKCFIFKCTKCLYRYNTGPSLGKARSLSMFIMNQISQTAYHKIYQNITKENDSTKEKISHHQIIPKHNTSAKTQNDNLAMFSSAFSRREINNENNIGCEEFDEYGDLREADIMARTRSLESFLSNSKYLDTQTQYSLSHDMEITRIIHDKEDKENIYSKLYPVPRKLRTKKKIVCKLCEKTLVEPVNSDLPQGLSKLLKSTDAVDYLPRLEILRFLNEIDTDIRPSDRARFALIFRNPSYTQKMKIKVGVIEGKHSEHGVQVTIPYDTFDLGEKFSILKQLNPPAICETNKEKIAIINKPENYIQFVPTVYLSKSTKYSRVELIKRGFDKPEDIFINYDENNKKTSENAMNRSFMSDDGNISQDSIIPNGQGVKPLDNGANWNCIAMNVYFSKVATEKYSFDIPLLINIDTIESDRTKPEKQYRSIYTVNMTISPTD